MNTPLWRGHSHREIERLTAEVKALRAVMAEQQRVLDEVRLEVKKHREGFEIFEKGFRVTGFWGDYIEFGAYRGDTIVQAYFASTRVLDELLSGRWDHSFDDKEAKRSGFQQEWDEMRFFSFDSFQGMPEPGVVDSIYPIFPRGSYACTQEEFRKNVRYYGIPDSKVIAVPGFFGDTLTDATARSLSLKRLEMIHIDSDLYESARDALNFCTPYICDGTIVIFDEWYQFRGNPTLGEQRAFQEWRDSHPEWIVTAFQKEGPFRNSFILNKPH